MVERWFVVFRRQTAADLRLYCLPCAGGGASMYRDWPQALGDGVEVCAVQLPGRESRLREAPAASIGALADALVARVRAHADRPFCLFGHSMGAVVAFELARRLLQRGDTPLRALFVAGAVAPSRGRALPSLSRLPELELVEALAARGGVAPALLAHPELLRLVIPTLRADLGACEAYTYEAGLALTRPIYAYAGDRDPGIGPGDLEAWRMETTAEFVARHLPGDHFFLQSESRDALLRDVRRKVKDHVAG